MTQEQIDKLTALVEANDWMDASVLAAAMGLHRLAERYEAMASMTDEQREQMDDLPPMQ